jgi:hypothetical protein
MKLLDTATYEDYGKEWYVQILSHYPTFAFLDIEWQWDEYPATELFPMLLISFGSRSLAGFSFRYKWFECRLDFLTSSPRNLQRYKRRYYSENYDD